ncbi:MAG: cysteine--tRNA ligase [Candidatus Nanoarchaeia archaeon]
MKMLVYNTLTHKKEEFKPIHGKNVGIYVCGITAYDVCHLGHARCAVSFDIIINYLKHKGYNVFYVSNITDVGHLTENMIVEDKIEKRAREKKLEPMELVDTYIREKERDYAALKITPPNIQPRATGHIVEMIDTIKILLEKGYAYEKNGSVYFDVDEFLKRNPNTDFGKLSRKKIEEQIAGARFEVHPDKKKPYDFALWKLASPQHIMKWTSPWGKGYPGWHIECSTMATKYLGQPFDIHGGGIEHAMLHHECEIAQAEAATGKKFVKYWLHVGMLNVEGKKMSKSLGNFVTIKDAINASSPEAVRLLIAQTHYRSPLDYTNEALLAAQRGVEKLDIFASEILSIKEDPPTKEYNKEVSALVQKVRKKFEMAMDDDFDTPTALAEVFSFISNINSYISKGKLNKENAEEVYSFLKDFDSIFKVLPEKKKPVIEKEFLEKLLKIREIARQKKEYEISDAIRTALKGIGVIVEDTNGKTKIRFS